MPILFVFIILAILYGIWRAFASGWLFRAILFVAGWFGLYVALRIWFDTSEHIALTLGDGTIISWAAVIPTIICSLCLVCTKVDF